MKKINVFALILALCFIFTGCEVQNAAKASDTGAEKQTDTASVTPIEKHVVDSKDDTQKENDHPDSEYYKINDYYNMESTDTRMMITHFKTYQQELGYTCGPSSAYMVLNYFDPETAKNYSEEKIAEICGSTGGGVGTSAGQLAEFFEKEIGWDVEYYMSHDKKFKDYSSFISEVVKWNLSFGYPIIVDWCISSGHWTTIIGFDDMGTETTSDDVLIFGDSGDSGDHYQDGYMTFSAVRFFRMWKESTPFDGKEVYKQQYVVAHPKDK